MSNTAFITNNLNCPVRVSFVGKNDQILVRRFIPSLKRSIIEFPSQAVMVTFSTAIGTCPCLFFTSEELPIGSIDVTISNSPCPPAITIKSVDLRGGVIQVTPLGISLLGASVRVRGGRC